MSIYTTTPHDAPEYKRLICGRTNDIAKLLDYISRKNSVALFGERLIGKTSVLYLLRDIINGEIDTYHSKLIDLELKQAIESLKEKIPAHKAIYVSLQRWGGESTVDSFVNLLHRTLQNSGLRNTLSETVQPNLVDTFEAVNNALPEDKLLVVLIDEVEELIRLKADNRVFGNLHSVTQSCPKICFVLAGAEYWHKQIKEKNYPIVRTIKTYYLKSAAQSPIERYLITNPLRIDLSPLQNISTITQTIVEWTECKPMYVQAVCDEIVTLGAGGVLPDSWEREVEEEVNRHRKFDLDFFYNNDNLDDASQKILALLANKPGLSVKQIGSSLGYSEKVIWDKIGDLEALDKVRKQGAEYRIAGTLIERWGQKTQDVPPIRNPWPQRAKWAGATISLLLAIWIYFYVHPPLHTFSFDLPEGVVKVRIPASLEQNETGTIIVSIQNTSQTRAYSTTVSLISPDIEYKKDGSNQIVFEAIGIGETKFWEPAFTSHSSASGNSFASRVLIANNASGFSETYPFDIHKRVWPIKHFWSAISVILVALGGFVVKQDLGQMITSLASGLLKLQSKD